jgi:hypothetical protein
MPLTGRYHPEHPAGESAAFAMSYENVIPVGIALAATPAPSLAIFTNTVPPLAADGDWTKGQVNVAGRFLWATLSGGKVGTDYILTWTATDTRGNVWPRSGLVLCAPTS